MSFKVDESVRIIQTGVQGLSDGKGGFRSTEVGNWIPEYVLESLGLSLELVEPELPEEPPIGTHISFTQEGGIVFLGDGDGYYRIGSDVIWSWEKVIERFGPYFTVLEERDKTIREVLSVLKGTGWSDNSYRLIAKHFGVSIDD